MPYRQILSRAFELVRQHRALWILGFLLALATGGGSGNGFNGSPPMEMPGMEGTSGNPELGALFGIILVVGICIAAILGIAALLLRYVSQVGLIAAAARADDRAPISVRASLRQGWSKQGFFAFLVEFVFNLILGLVIAAGVILGLGFLAAGIVPGIAMVENNNGGLGAIFIVLGALLGMGILLVVTALALVLSMASSLMIQWSLREIVLGKADLTESVRRAWQLIRSQPRESVLFGLLMWGLRVVFSVAIVPLGLLAVGIVLGPAALLYDALDSIIPAIIVGAPLALAALVGLSLFSGFYMAFDQTAWTLAWRWLRGQREPAPLTPEAPDLTEPDAPAFAGG